MPKTVIELKVRNHPEAMSHVTGLFARRSYHLEGILCGPMSNQSKSLMFLLVNQDDRLNRIMMNLEKLYDVFEVSLRNDYDQTLFNRLYEFSGAGENE